MIELTRGSVDYLPDNNSKKKNAAKKPPANTYFSSLDIFGDLILEYNTLGVKTKFEIFLEIR